MGREGLFHKGFTYVLIYIAVLCMSVGLLVMSALIPKGIIRSNMQSSAEYIASKRQFFCVVEGDNSSKIDRYADAILLSIAYHFDDKKPLSSVMESSYYHDEKENENLNFLRSVKEDLPANFQYLRYWHGSAGIMRIMHTVFDVRQIYILHGIILLVLIAVFMAMLIKHGMTDMAVGVALSLIVIKIWYVPMSLEYTWVFIIMLAGSIVCFDLVIHGREKYLGGTFMVTGMVTTYLDFLTAETITLTVPLILSVYLYYFYKKDSMGPILKRSAGNVFLWAIGYVGMWLSKWALASVVLGGNVMPYVSEHVEERIGDVNNIGFLGLSRLIIVRNVSCLLPPHYGGLFLAAALLALAYVLYVYRKKSFDKAKIGLYAAIACIPYIRLLALQNHSFLHFFFTYRSQMVVMIAIVLIAHEVIDCEVMGIDFHRRKRA